MFYVTSRARRLHGFKAARSWASFRACAAIYTFSIYTFSIWGGLSLCSCEKDNSTTPVKEFEKGTRDVRGLPPVVVDRVSATDFLLALRPHQVRRTGWCVQIRSLIDKVEAEALVAKIEDETGQAVTILSAAIANKGTWHRVCVGAEASRGQAARRAAAWTGKKGLLRPYMLKPKRGQARYFIKERTAQSDRKPSDEQARVLLGAVPTERRRVMLARRGENDLYWGAVTTPPNDEGRSNVLLVDDKGRIFAIPTTAPPRCTACRAALKEAPVVSREALLVGNFLPGAGEEILIEEETALGARFLRVLHAGSEGSASAGPEVVAGIFIGRDRPALRLLSSVERIEADTDPQHELAIVRHEMPIVGDGICQLRSQVEVYSFEAHAVVRLDARAIEAAVKTEGTSMASGRMDRVRRVSALASALDRLDDTRAASRLCRAMVQRSQDAEVTRHCMRRVGALRARGDALAAVNAAGLLAEINVGFLPAIAVPLFDAASAVDRDESLVLVGTDCARHPLVAAASSRTLEENLRLAETTLASSVRLADVVDAVFVTGRRDFGRATPVGKLTEAWLQRYKKVLPGRYAAIEALLTVSPQERAAGSGNKEPTQ